MNKRVKRTLLEDLLQVYHSTQLNVKIKIILTVIFVVVVKIIKCVL